MISVVRLDQLLQLTKVTHDGDLISKSDRDALISCGYVEKCNGWNFITLKGVIVLDNLNVLKAKMENGQELT